MLESALEPREIDCGKQHEGSADHAARRGNMLFILPLRL